MDWPPHSPDYNITEAVWDQTENRKKTTTNQRTALNVFQEAWRTIPEETRRKIAKEQELLTLKHIRTGLCFLYTDCIFAYVCTCFSFVSKILKNEG